MKDLRLPRAERLLAEIGLNPRLSLAGQDDDVLAIEADLAQLEQLRELAPDLKALGFRYVALELKTEPRTGDRP